MVVIRPLQVVSLPTISVCCAEVTCPLGHVTSLTAIKVCALSYLCRGHSLEVQGLATDADVRPRLKKRPDLARQPESLTDRPKASDAEKRRLRRLVDLCLGFVLPSS